MNQKPVSPLRLGVAGLGTVGATVVQSLLAGAIDHVVVTRVSARTPDKERGFDMAGIAFEADPLDLVSADDVDVGGILAGRHPVDPYLEAASKDDVLRGKAQQHRFRPTLEDGP